jgi:ribosomal protein S18 acetylase RimI-like enzyme
MKVYPSGVDVTDMANIQITKQPTALTKNPVRIKDARWSELSPEMQQLLAEKMLRLREYLGDEEVVQSLNKKVSRADLADKLQRGLKDKPWYKEFRTHMAYKNGRPVGMITTRPERNSKSVYVDNLYVDPNYRNIGVGHSLMQSVINRAKAAGAKQIRLGVDYKNIAARKLYEKLGMQPESMLLKKEV